MRPANTIIAYYDDLCPIYLHEMHTYVGKVPKLIRLNSCNGDLPDDIDRTAALASAHIRLPDGRVETGWSAFLTIWDGMRAESRTRRWPARLTRPPPIRILMKALFVAVSASPPRAFPRQSV